MGILFIVILVVICVLFGYYIRYLTEGVVFGKNQKDPNAFEANDLVLSHLALPDPCPIKLQLDDNKNCVILKVGPRDWAWNIDTGELVAVGCELAEKFGSSGK